MRRDSRLSKCFAALHLTIIGALVGAELAGFIRSIVPPFVAPPAAAPAAFTAQQGAPPPPAPALVPRSPTSSPALESTRSADLRPPLPAPAAVDGRRWHPLDGVKFVPERRDGQTLGLRLREVGEDGLFAKLGLREGDRLDSVGGYRVTSPSEMIALYARLRALDVLKVLIEREGQPMTITIHLR